MTEPFLPSSVLTSSPGLARRVRKAPRRRPPSAKHQRFMVLRARGQDVRPRFARSALIPLVEGPQVCSSKFLTCEQWSVLLLTGAGGGSAQGFRGGLVIA